MISRHPAVEHTERASVAILSQLHHLQGVDEAFLRWKRANSYWHIAGLDFDVGLCKTITAMLALCAIPGDSRHYLADAGIAIAVVDVDVAVAVVLRLVLLLCLLSLLLSRRLRLAASQIAQRVWLR